MSSLKKGYDLKKKKKNSEQIKFSMNSVIEIK